METAQLVEEKNLAFKSIKDPVWLKFNRLSYFNTARAQEGIKLGSELTKPLNITARDGKHQSEEFLTRPISWGTRPPFPTKENPSRRRLNLTEAEVQARREKGLCFHCDEKYTLGHHCKGSCKL